MDRPKRKHIYYIAGIISLTILPIAFIFFADIEIKKRTLTVLPILLEDKNLSKKFPKIFKKFSFPPKRKYNDMNFNGDNQKDKIKLDFAQIRMAKFFYKMMT